MKDSGATRKILHRVTFSKLRWNGLCEALNRHFESILFLLNPQKEVDESLFFKSNCPARFFTQQHKVKCEKCHFKYDGLDAD